MEKMDKYLLAFFILIGLLGSCVEEQNFDQYDDLQIAPTVEASILYVESPESYINQASVPYFFSQNFNFDAFSEQYFAEKVLDGAITYEIENTTSKQLEILVEFLDEAGNILDSELFMVEPAPTEILQREVAYGSATGRSIEIIKNTSGIRVSARNLGDNTSVSGLPDPKIIIRSSGKFRIDLK